MEDKMADIRERLIQLRRQCGYSYQDLAEKTGLSKSSLQRYETGQIQNIPLSQLEPLALALHTTPSYLLGWEDDEDMQIYLSLQISREALSVVRMFPRKLDKELGATYMDAFNAMIENPRFDKIIGDILYLCSADSTWNRLAKQYNEKYSPKNQINSSQAKEMFQSSVTLEFSKLIQDIMNTGVKTFNKIQKTEHGLTIEMRDENKTLYEFIHHKKDEINS